MAIDAKLLFRALSPRVIGKALAVIDKSTAIVVSTCWLAALITLIMAAFAVHGAVSVKKEAMDAIIAEPVLPEATTTPITARESQLILDRLQRQFPDIKFDLGPNQALIVRSDDGAKFHQWITALSYVDTMAPEFHWGLRDFCVGACGNDIMKATATGQRVSFALPQKP